MRTVLLALFVMLALATAAGAQYPEYNGNTPLPSLVQPYSLPDYGEFNPRWVRFWNSPGHFAQDTWLASYGDTARADECDGIAYDGHLIPNAKPTTDGKVMFRFPEAEEYDKVRFFYEDQMTNDPRLTNWWMAFCADSTATLWQAVEQAAMTQDYPQLTRAILRHMEQCGVVDLGQVWQMILPQIRRAMFDYTNLALVYNERQTRQAVGRHHLTEQRFKALKPGQQLEMHYAYRFGPTPEANERLVVIAAGDSASVRYANDPESRPFTLRWEGLARIAQYVKVQ